jgi:hypothetical protein
MFVLSEDFQKMVDEDKLSDALNAANFLAQKFIPTGRYNVDEAWGPEGLLYLAESSYALHSSYEITKDQIYLNAVRAILDELRRAQKKSGGWALELGKDGVGFKTSDEIRAITSEIEDLPPTVAVLKTIADYQKLSGDDSYSDMGNRAFNYLMDHWDAEYGSFLEKKNSKLMALRSNPRSYHLFSFIGILAWKEHEPRIVAAILPSLLNFIKSTFESYDDQTMPLVYGLHAANLVQHCSHDYITNVIKPRIDNHLVNNPTFMIHELKGAYGHRDGLRGIVKDEAHMRSAAGIAIAMKFYDLYTNTRTYRDREIYRSVESWIQNMKGNSFYYEFEMLPERKKIGYGSPGQYLPIWWILGKI